MCIFEECRAACGHTYITSCKECEYPGSDDCIMQNLTLATLEYSTGLCSECKTRKLIEKMSKINLQKQGSRSSATEDVIYDVVPQDSAMEGVIFDNTQPCQS